MGDAASRQPRRERPVSVWRLSLRGRVDCRVLSPRERLRSAALRYQADRQRFVLARSALRSLLAVALDMPPAEVAIVARSRSDKPRLPPEYGIKFSVAHAGDAILIAIAFDLDLGVDIEPHAPPRPLLVPRLVLHPAELTAFAAISPTGRPSWLLRRWVLKEAVGKASGLGLAIDFTRVTLSGGDGAPYIARHGQSKECWTVMELAYPVGYHAALATSGTTVPQIIERTWQDDPATP